MTKIEWTDKVWNPVHGCDRVSAGCDHCYALTMAKRLKGMGLLGYQNEGDPNTSGPGFAVTLAPERLQEPLRWRRPHRIFVNSMSDLFHDEIPDNFIGDVFNTMALAKHHTFQILTKRPGRMRSLLKRWARQAEESDSMTSANQKACWRRTDMVWCSTPVWPLPNVWLGISAEDQKWADIRIPVLLDTPAAVRFVSAEPLLGPIDFRRHLTACEPQLHWVITGGESGHGARPAHPDWFRSIADQCHAAGGAFLHKQNGEWIGQASRADIPRDPDAWVNRKTGAVADDVAALQDGGSWAGVWRVGKKKAGRELDGHTWDEYPAVLT